MNEKEEAAGRTGGLQRKASSGEVAERELIKKNLRGEITAIRDGHTTGGYCDTDKLKAAERKLAAILSAEVEEFEAQQPSPSTRKAISDIEREIRGFAWKPKLVVAPEQ